MTEAVPILAVLVPALPLVCGALVLCSRSAAVADRLSVASAVAVAATSLTLAGSLLARGGSPPLRGSLYLLDGASGSFLALIAVIGLCSALLSPTYLRTAGRSWLASTRSRHWYYAAFYAFWSALLAVPIAANLGVAWLLVEATTAASAVLVGFTGGRHALEAAWKYLVLTTLGLSIALLGIVVLALALARHRHGGLTALDWHALSMSAPGLPRETALVAFVLILVGLATKIGWAPVHNWLPDAHSEAPAPISALLSAALLPTVALVAWRVKTTLGTAVGAANARGVLIAFGLASLVVAVPFLWRSLPWKRLLAYSSLEHMGVVALGIGFGTPLAVAGVVLHVAGHGLAKALGFYAALPLLRADPDAAARAPAGVLVTSRSTAAAMGLSLGVLGGLPPSPLFVSELLILAGGLAGGHAAIVVVAAFALAMGFLGLLHAVIEGVIGPADGLRQIRPHRGERPVAVLTILSGIVLSALTIVGLMLPGSAFVTTLARGAL